jgi:hypothetical protein
VVADAARWVVEREEKYDLNQSYERIQFPKSIRDRNPFELHLLFKALQYPKYFTVGEEHFFETGNKLSRPESKVENFNYSSLRK